MTNNDINDDEIRIVTRKSSPTEPSRKPKRRPLLLAAIAVAVIVAIAAIGYVRKEKAAQEPMLIVNVEEPLDTATVGAQPAAMPSALGVRAYVDIADTTAGGVPLVILTPQGATASLHIGSDVVSDSTAVMVMQAADIRRDNGGIVGAYVCKGELISKGRSKSGFCAIIGGSITIGVADSTPLLEQAIETDGYFFRQYPLVEGGQVVENKPQNSSLRKALAELDGRIVVVMSRSRLTFHEFSQALVDLGVSNAIYLVGGSNYSFATDATGRKVTFGAKPDTFAENVNYIVWR